MSENAAGDEVYGKPFHGWSCDCDECKSYDERGEPRPGEAPRAGGKVSDTAARCADGHEPALATGVCVRCGVDPDGYYDGCTPEFRLAITQGLMDEGCI